MSHVALVLHDAGGTVPPMLALAAALGDRGHDVTVLSQPSVADRAAAVGARFVPLSTVPDYDHTKAFEAQLDVVGEAMVGRGPGDDLLALGADLAVVDANLAGAAAAAEASGRPSAILLHSLLRTYTETWFGDLWPLLEGAVNATRSTFGFGPATGWLDVFAGHDRRLAVVPAVLDDAPDVAHFGFLVPPATGDPPPWPGGDGPTVLVTLGTTQQDQRGAVQAIVDDLAARPVRAVVTTGRSVAPGDLDAPPHVALHASVPHGLLLPATDVVVAHAGLGTVAAALHHGVPLVCTPFDRDQPLNAARVEALGAGVTTTPATVGDALDRVLADPAYRAAAGRVAAASRAEGGAAAAAADLEALL